MGQSNTNTLARAEQEQPPTPPVLLRDMCKFVAKVIVQRGATNFTEVENPFDTAFATTAATVHNELGGLQGGIASEYYHLTSAEYAALAKLDAGTVSGQMAFWDHANSKWVHTETNELVWDDTNKRLGIGTATPAYGLDVNVDKINIKEDCTFGVGAYNADSSLNFKFDGSADSLYLHGASTGVGSTPYLNFYIGDNSYTVSTYIGGTNVRYSHLYIYSDYRAHIRFGSATTVYSEIKTVQNADFSDPAFLLSVGSGHRRTFILTDYANSTKRHDHAAQTNPTLYIHSATSPDTDNTQWMSLTHDQTDGVIATGKGNIKLNPASSVSIVGTGAAGSTPALVLTGYPNVVGGSLQTVTFQHSATVDGQFDFTATTDVATFYFDQNLKLASGKVFKIDTATGWTGSFTNGDGDTVTVTISEEA
jgi:hypothetical protein